MLKTKIIDNDFFKQSWFNSYLITEPIGFMDIGARFGSHSLVEPLHSHVSFLGFEPDKEECDRLNADPLLKKPWNEFKILPHALSDGYENRILNITSLANNSSLLELNQLFVKRYHMEDKWTVTRQCKVATKPLDHILYDLNLGFKNAGEIIKIDTQGTELAILQGAKRLLSDKTVCIIAEVEFFQIYKEQKLFADIELYLRELGFSFYGFLNQYTRSKKLLNKKTNFGRERLFYADAVFFKDPLSNESSSLTQRQYYVLLFATILTGYFDYALELTASGMLDLPEAEINTIRQLIASVSFVDPKTTEQRVDQLLAKIGHQQENANLLLGKFMDTMNFPDFDDCSE